MISLLTILEQVIMEEEVGPELERLATDLAQEIQNSAKGVQNNSLQKEAVLASAALVLALPGILKAIGQFSESIAKKTGINLSKSNKDPWYKKIQQTSEKIDSYLVAPFEKAVSVFIKDEEKRKKVARIIKALTLTSMSIIGGLDAANIKDVTDTITKTVPEIGSELIQSITQKNASSLGKIAKDYFQNYLSK